MGTTKILFAFSFFSLISSGEDLERKFPTLPQPMPQVEFLTGKPDVRIEIYNPITDKFFENPNVVYDSPYVKHASKLIVLDYSASNRNEPVLKESLKPTMKTHREHECFVIFKSNDNIWNATTRVLSKDRPHTSKQKMNALILEKSKSGALLNSVKVPTWHINGLTLHTRMPIGYPLSLYYLYPDCDK